VNAMQRKHIDMEQLIQSLNPENVLESEPEIATSHNNAPPDEIDSIIERLESEFENAEEIADD
jgi:hypothetical protein